MGQALGAGVGIPFSRLAGEGGGLSPTDEGAPTLTLTLSA